MILVVGATGSLGGEICRRLVSRGEKVRGLVRATSNRETVARLMGQGIETVDGDLKDLASLRAACGGTRSVITTATTTISRQPDDSIEATDQQGQLNLIDAAVAEGVERFVYVSYSQQVEPTDPSPLTVAKRTVEERVRSSGMSFTILRPTFFQEIWLSPPLGFDYPSGKAPIYGSGQNKISWIAMADVADFAVQSLDNPAALNATCELGGPEALSPLEVVAVFERASSRRFEVTHVPEEVLHIQRAAATDSLQKSFAGLMLSYAACGPIDMHDTLQAFPIELTSVRHYAGRVLAPAL